MKYLTEREAGKEIGVSMYTLQQYRHKEIGPKYYILPFRRIRYLKEDLINWQEGEKIVKEPNS